MKYLEFCHELSSHPAATNKALQKTDVCLSCTADH